MKKCLPEKLGSRLDHAVGRMAFRAFCSIRSIPYFSLFFYYDSCGNIRNLPAIPHERWRMYQTRSVRRTAGRGLCRT